VLTAARAARPPTDQTGPGRRSRRAGAGRTGRPWWVAAAAVAALVALIAGFVGYSLAPKASEQEQFLAFLAQPSARVVSLQGAPGERISVAIRPGASQAWVVASNLPTPSGRRVYELWFSRSGQDSVNPAGTFVPEEGSVLARATVDPNTDLLAVTIEPPGGSRQPTMKPIFASQVA
jgi:anti-sigma-K factor RskA